MARKRAVPSTGAMNSTLHKTQVVGKIDAIYNGRPLELAAPSICIFHPVFARFLHELAQPINKASFTVAELKDTHDLVTNSLAFYKIKTDRIKNIKFALSVLVDSLVLNESRVACRDTCFTSDGYVTVHCTKLKGIAASTFTEVKNGIGEGGSDPLLQAQCDYVAFHSDEDVSLFLSKALSAANGQIAQGHSRCLLLSCFPHWDHRSVHDNLWCHY